MGGMLLEPVFAGALWHERFKSFLVRPKLISSPGLSDLGDFMDAIKGGHVDGSANFSKISSSFSNQGVVMCDLLAAIIAVHPELIVRSENYPVSVELQGQYTRSMMVVDRMRNGELAEPILPNSATAKLVLTVNMEKVAKLSGMIFFWSQSCMSSLVCN